jgi:hypothetical protein
MKTGTQNKDGTFCPSVTVFHIRKSSTPLNAQLNPICHLLTLLGAHHIFHVSRVKLKVR